MAESSDQQWQLQELRQQLARAEQRATLAEEQIKRWQDAAREVLLLLLCHPSALLFASTGHRPGRPHSDWHCTPTASCSASPTELAWCVTLCVQTLHAVVLGPAATDAFSKHAQQLMQQTLLEVNPIMMS